MKEVFISYATPDESSAEEIAQLLGRRKVDFFMARKAIQGDGDVTPEIRKAVEGCRTVVVLFTPQSLKSRWLEVEYTTALELQKDVVPVLLRCDLAQLPEPLRHLQILDFHELPHFVARFGEDPTVELVGPRQATEEELVLARRYKAMLRHLDFVVPEMESIREVFAERMTYVSPEEMPPPFESIANLAFDPELDLYPAGVGERIMIDAIHAGDLIPKSFVHDVATNRNVPNATAEIVDGFFREKDWGANHLALAVAQCLNLPAFYRVNVARVLLDYGRFPGVTLAGPNEAHLYRKAINYPFTELSHPLKMSLLNDYYNRISAEVEKAIRGKIVKIAIHTYDPYEAVEERNRWGTLRPDVSLVFSPIGYHVEKRMPKGIYDPLYPDELGVFSGDRRLIARITLDLEREGITVAYNYPYHLPEGSVEVRAQVWMFFEHLKDDFNEAHPQWKGEPAFDLVWDMLLDTNLRSPNAELLRSYIHMFRETPDVLSGFEGRSAVENGNRREVGARLEQSRLAYEEIGRYLQKHWQRLVTSYRRSPYRPSALVVEVRKDILWEYDENRRPVEGCQGLKIEGLRKMAHLISKAILTYLNKDRRDLVDL